MGRGKERLVICEQCGRQVRRDKAVFFEKAIFSNPLEKKDIAEGNPYVRVITREVAYCPSCGKHRGIYKKKIEQNQRRQERERAGGFQRSGQEGNRNRQFGFRSSRGQREAQVGTQTSEQASQKAENQSQNPQ